MSLLEQAKATRPKARGPKVPDADMAERMELLFAYLRGEVRGAQVEAACGLSNRNLAAFLFPAVREAHRRGLLVIKEQP